MEDSVVVDIVTGPSVVVVAGPSVVVVLGSLVGSGSGKSESKHSGFISSFRHSIKCKRRKTYQV